MITTVTLNAAIDKTYYIPGFSSNALYRVDQTLATAGGKGINVARVIHALREKVTATGFVAGYNGMAITEMLREEGIETDFISVPGESRLCLNIIDPTGGTQTELLEAGPIITPESIDAMKAKVEALAAQSSHIVFSGSLPKGCGTNLYAELIDIARSQGAIPVLDTSGDALIAGIQSQPYMIKPNEHEVARLTDGSADREDEIEHAVQQLMQNGVHNIVVSLGERGAIAGCEGQLYGVSIPRVESVNAVGSGDSMVAGLVVADRRGLSPEEKLKLGAACGTANALMPSAGMVRMADIESLLREVQVTPLSSLL